MAQYKALHRLGVYICGLGSRECGGVFTVTDEKAALLGLDSNPNLERIDGKSAKRSKPTVSEPATPDESKEG